jgi:hypothetical protein
MTLIINLRYPLKLNLHFLGNNIKKLENLKYASNGTSNPGCCPLVSTVSMA